MVNYIYATEMIEELKAENEALKKALKDQTEADEKMVAALEALPVELAEMDLDLPDDALPLYGDPRPMSEAPRDGTEILVIFRHGDDFAIVGWGAGNEKWNEAAGSYAEDSLLGWWPLPKGRT